MSTLGLPLALAIVVGSYAAIKKELASRQELEQFKAEHGGKTPAQVTLAWRTGQCDSLLLTGCPRALLS